MKKKSPALPAVSLSTEVAAKFRMWYERNFLNARTGERKDDSGYGDADERARADHAGALQADELDFLLKNPLVALQLALGVTDLRGLRCLRRGLSQCINDLQMKSYRNRYYDHDNARRRLLAAELHKIRRRATLNPCPSPEAFREAFTHRVDSIEASIRFGELVYDVAGHVDSCLRIDARGEILGRNGGVKAWIAENVPELRGRYKTVMRYKMLAKRAREAAGKRNQIH